MVWLRMSFPLGNKDSPVNLYTATFALSANSYREIRLIAGDEFVSKLYAEDLTNSCTNKGGW